MEVGTRVRSYKSYRISDLSSIYTDSYVGTDIETVIRYLNPFSVVQLIQYFVVVLIVLRSVFSGSDIGPVIRSLLKNRVISVLFNPGGRVTKGGGG